MATGWAETNVKRWLRGQRVAAKKVEEERVRFLLQLKPDDSLRIYLSLWHISRGARSDAEKPSPLLWRMRRALALQLEEKRKRA